MRRDKGVGFALHRCVVDFQSPARLDDLLEVRTRLRGLKGARVNAEQCLYKVLDNGVDPDWCVRLEVELVCIGRYGRPVRLPQGVHESFKTALVSDS